MRVTFLTQVKKSFTKARNGAGAEFLVKSVGSLRNWLQQKDRQTELPIAIRQEQVNKPQSPDNSVQNRAVITTNDFFITDALELIEDDAANNTIMVNENAMSDEEVEEKKAAKPKVFKEDNEIPKIMWDFETITDWSERIANYTPQQRQFYETMVPKINELKNIMNSNSDWSVLVEYQADKLKIETKKSVRGFTICRAQGPIDWAPIDVLRCMLHFPFRKEWDINCDFCQFEKKVGANGFYFYNRTISKTGFSARDFVLNLIYNVEADGTVLWCASSHNCSYEKPNHHGTTRGDTPISGLILKPVAG